MKASLVLVHYHTPELARWAVESLRADLADARSAGLEAEVLLVDNGSDAAGRQRLEALDVRLLDPGGNVGFAAGVNLGVAAAEGDLLLVGNPDLELLPGCLAALAAAVGRGAAVAGPRFWWDRGRRLVLPPTERRDRRSEAAARLAARGEGWARRARAGWRRHARRHWQAEEAVASLHLSGALLAFPRSTWDAVGPFDAGYRLYFEETDWLRRLRRAGLAAVYEPRAEVVHRHGQAALAEPRAAAWFAESEARFQRRWYGAGFRWLLRRLPPAGPRLALPPPPALPPGRPSLDLAGRHPAAAGPLWVELSPLARGFPAAAERLPPGSAAWELPEEVWQGMEPGTWRLAVTDDAGRELFATSFARPPGAR